MPRLSVLLMLTGALTLSGCASSAATADAATVQIRRDLVYVTRADAGELKADLYQPAASGSGLRPAVVVVHGGGWVRGERSQMQHIVDALVARDYVVLNISYRLAPQYPYPAAVDDVRAALRWLSDHAETYGVDRRRLALWGYSAGAHLAGLVAAVPEAQTPPLAAAIVGGMPADLVRAQNSDLVQKFIGGTIEQYPQRYVEASPLQQLSKRSAPMLFYHGSWDLIVWAQYSRDMHARLQALGVDTELVPLAARGHIAAFFLDGAAKQSAFAFLERHFAAVNTRSHAAR